MSQDAPDRTRDALAVLTLLIAAVPLLGRLSWAPWTWLLWSDRDLVRSADGAGLLRTTGAELSYGVGAGLPGGAMHWVYGLPLLFTDNADAVYRWQSLGELLGIGALLIWLTRRWGLHTAAVFAAIWTSSDIPSHVMAGLWNPALATPWIALAYLALLSHTEEPAPSKLLAFGAWVGLAAQMHLSALIVFVAAAPMLVWRATHHRSAASALLGGLLLPYVPHVLHEVVAGAPNTRLLLDPGQILDAAPNTWATHLSSNATAMVTMFHGGEQARMAAYSDAVPAALARGMPLALVACAEGLVRVRHRAAVLPLASVLTLGVAYVLRSSVIDLLQAGGERYLLVLLPALALLAAIGLTGLGRAPQRIVLVLFAAGTLTRTTGWGIMPAPTIGHSARYDHVVGGLRALADDLGVEPAEAAARSILIHNGSAATPAALGVDFLVGAPGPPSPPPCGLIFTMWQDERDTLDSYLEPALPDLVAPITVRSLTPVNQTTWAITYDTGASLCPTSFSNRYLLRPPERELFRQWSQLRDQIPVPGAEANTWLVKVADAALALTVEQIGDRVLAHLESNQLRGVAYNDGWFTNVTLGSLELHVQGGGQQVVLRFADDLIGERGVITPLDISSVAPPPPWGLTLSGEGVTGEDRRPFTIPIATRHTPR